MLANQESFCAFPIENVECLILNLGCPRFSEYSDGPVVVIVERVAGKIKAAPIPLRALKAITSFASEAPKNSKSLVNNNLSQ